MVHFFTFANVVHNICKVKPNFRSYAFFYEKLITQEGQQTLFSVYSIEYCIFSYFLIHRTLCYFFFCYFFLQSLRLPISYKSKGVIFHIINEPYLKTYTIFGQLEYLENVIFLYKRQSPSHKVYKKVKAYKAKAPRMTILSKKHFRSLFLL